MLTKDQEEVLKKSFILAFHYINYIEKLNNEIYEKLIKEMETSLKIPDDTTFSDVPDFEESLADCLKIIKKGKVKLLAERMATCGVFESTIDILNLDIFQEVV